MSAPTDLEAIDQIIARLRPLRSAPVECVITDSPAGWWFVRVSGTVTHIDVDADERSVVVTFDDGGASIRLFGDMIKSVEGDAHVLRIGYRAGDLDVAAARDGEPRSGRRAPAD